MRDERETEFDQIGELAPPAEQMPAPSTPKVRPGFQDESFDADLREWNEAMARQPEVEPDADANGALTALEADPETVDDFIGEFSTRAEVSEGKQALREAFETLQTERELLDIRAAMGRLRSDVPEADSLADETLVSLLAGVYGTDPGFRDAWAGRQTDPASWDMRLWQVSVRAKSAVAATCRSRRNGQLRGRRACGSGRGNERGSLTTGDAKPKFVE